MLELKDVILHSPAGRQAGRPTDSQSRRPLSFLIQPGDICCVGGGSGSGKTTLVRSVLGFCPVASGYISIDGELVNWLSAPTFRRQIFYIPSDVSAEADVSAGGGCPSPFDDLTVRQLIEAQLQLGINRINIDNDHLSEAWQLLGLDESVGERRCGELSAGEMRRALLSIGSQIHRDLLIADELTTGLTVEEEQKTFRFVRAMAQSGSAVLLTCLSDDLLLKQEENEHFIIRDLSGFDTAGASDSTDGQTAHTHA